MRSCSNIAGIYMISWCNISEKKHSHSPPLSRTGGCESALFALLFTYSPFWHMHWLARRKTNDKTQLSASFPWGMKRLNSLHPSLGAWKNPKKKQKTCPQCLQSLERCHFKFQRVCSRIWVTLSAAYCRYTADHRIDADVCMCRPVGDSHFSITSISQTLLLLLLDSFYGESSPPLTKTMWVEALIWNIGEFGIVWPEASPNHLQTINYN